MSQSAVRSHSGTAGSRLELPHEVFGKEKRYVIRNSNALALIPQPTLEFTCRGHRSVVNSVCFSGSSLYSTPSLRPGRPERGVLPKVISCSSDGAITLWDSKATHRSLRNTAHRSPVLCCDASPRGLAVASGGHNGYAQLWVPNLRRTTSTYPAAWSFPAASGDEDEQYQWKAHSGGTRAIAFAQDGTDQLYTAGDDKAIKCWDLNYIDAPSTRSRDVVGGSWRGVGCRFVSSFSVSTQNRTAATVSGHTNWVRSLAVQGPHTHGAYFHLLASGGDDGCVFLWDTRTQRSVDVLREPRASVRGLGFHPTGYALACGDANGSIQVYDLRRTTVPMTVLHKDGEPDVRTRPSHTLLQMYPAAHQGTVHDLSFTPDGNWLISVGADSLIQAWDVLEGHLYCSLQAHTGGVKTCSVSPDGAFFATGGMDQNVLVWRLCLPHPSRTHSHTEARAEERVGIVQETPSPQWTDGRVDALKQDVEEEAPQPHTTVPQVHHDMSTRPFSDEDELEPRKPLYYGFSGAVAKTQSPAPQPLKDYTFRRSEERLDAFSSKHASIPRSGVEVADTARMGDDEVQKSHQIYAEQQQLKEDLRDLRTAIVQLAKQRSDEGECGAPSSVTVQQLQEDVAAIQLRQRQEFQELRAMLTSWMASNQRNS